MKGSTAEMSSGNLFEGEKKYIQQARKALPILVRQARAQEPIFYSDLANELGMPNPRNLNNVLGAIGNALKELSQRTPDGKKIPAINCLVINKQQRLPGEGVAWFIDKEDFKKLSRNQKIETIKRISNDIYIYPRWDWVLEQLKLTPVKTDYSKKIKPKLKRFFGGTGESPDHKRFKNFIAKNSKIFGLKSSIIGQTEYEFPSADKIDVLFRNGDEVVGVEVKSKISNNDDVLRGIFQCVKYKALIEAEQKVNDMVPNCRVVLALEGEFPKEKEFEAIKNQLGVEVMEKIKNIHEN